MKKPFIAGNWKMNLCLKDAITLAETIKTKTENVSNVDIGICPSFVFLGDIAKVVKGSNIRLGSQNMHSKESGAYTGEVSGQMIKDIGCSHVIIGHSERRHVFGETDEFINKKLKSAFSFQLAPIFCVGETLEERGHGKTTDIIDNQLREGLRDINYENIKTLTIAYEPVWAIGTGKSASPEQANEVHTFIRKFITKEYGEEIAEGMVIQYGGSVKPDNINDLLLQTDIDGALTGGASLESESFLKIIEIADKITAVKEVY